MDKDSTSAVTGASAEKTPRKGGCMRFLFFGALCALMILPVLVYLTDTPRRVKRGVIEIIEAAKEQPEPVVKVEKVTEEVEVVVEKVVEKVVEVPAPPPPLPSKFIARRSIDTAELYNGFIVKSVLDLEEGRNASVEREDPAGYEIELTLRIKAPKPSQTVEELASLNPDLPNVLADLDKLVAGSKVSGFYHKIYDIKAKRVQQYLTRLDKLLSRHNYYDCETILEMQHPETGKRVLFLQGEMDVVSDGTDGDRMPELNEYIANSAYFQPFTSYGWGKRTKQPNPLLAKWQSKLKEAEEEYKVKGLSAERNRYLRARIDLLKREIADLKARSFLIGQKDPFIVIPLSMLGYTKTNAFAPAIGDYAVIVYGNTVYPAIVGDAGPTFKTGEASLRVAKTFNEKASPYSRPESDLKVTYLVFPKSADKQRGPPDLDRWRERCLELLDGIGGVGEGAVVYRWEDLLKPEPETEPKPEPEPTPEPVPATEPENSSDTPTPETPAPAEGDAPASP